MGHALCASDRHQKGIVYMHVKEKGKRGPAPGPVPGVEKVDAMEQTLKETKEGMDGSSYAQKEIKLAVGPNPAGRCNGRCIVC